jgi:transcriptional regulator with XRE-family HTH domain
MNSNQSIDWLIQRRAELNMSQTELARKLHNAGIKVSRVTVSNWETKKVAVPLGERSFRVALSAALLWTEKELLARAGYEVEPRTYSPMAEEIATIVEQLSEQEQKMILAMSRALLDLHPPKRFSFVVPTESPLNS